MRTLLVTGMLAGVLAGCSFQIGGGDDEYDPADVAAQVQKAQEKEAPDLEVTDASCPDDEPEEGATIECTIAIDGVEAAYAVTFTSVADDGVQFDIKPARAIVSVEKAETGIADGLDGQGFADVTVDCGEDRVIVDDPGETFTCRATQKGSGSVPVTVTIKDLEGNIGYTIGRGA